MTEPSQLQATAAAYAIEQIHATVDEIREAWAWLVELAEPGPAGPAPTPPATEQVEEQLTAHGYQQRAWRAYNLAHGMSALPPSPAPVRVAVVDAQVAVDQLVAKAVLTLAETGGERTQARADAAVAAGVPRMLDWIAGWEVARLGADGRGGVWIKLGAIGRVRDAELAADVEQILRRAARTARAAAGVDAEQPAEPVIDDQTRRPARCPACGRRSLQQTFGSDGRPRLIRCVSQSCLCTGDAQPDRPECGCRRSEKREGLGHVWIRSTEHELWNAIDRAYPNPAHRSIGRGAAGHGGWQSRDMAGQQ